MYRVEVIIVDNVSYKIVVVEVLGVNLKFGCFVYILNLVFNKVFGMFFFDKFFDKVCLVVF